MVRSGKYRHPIVILKQAATLDNLGQKRNNSWSNFVSTVGNVIELTGSEREKNHQIVAAATLKIECRWIHGVTEKMRVLHRDRTLEILAVLDTEQQQREMVLLCGEVKR